MQVDDDIYCGPAVSGGSPPSGGSPGVSVMNRGVGPMGRIYIFDAGTPATLSATAICAVQAVAGAGNATLNGALAGLDPNTGATVATLPEGFGRALSMISTNAGDTTQTVTITGVDCYGQTMSQVKTLNGTTIVNFTKAFKKVTRVAISAALTGNFSCGTRDALGLPVVVTDNAYIVRCGYNNVVADDACTFVAADATSPATSATTDVRGLVAPSSAFNGSKRLVIAIALTGSQVGVNATRLAAFGVTQA